MDQKRIQRLVLALLSLYCSLAASCHSVVAIEKATSNFNALSLSSSGELIVRNLLIYWSEGVAVKGDTDYEVPIKVCPADSVFVCIAVPGTMLTFSIPKSDQPTQWFFVGRTFRVIHEHQTGADYVRIVESFPTSEEDREMYFNGVSPQVLFWYSDSHGLVAFQYRANFERATSQSLTFFSDTLGLKLNEVEHIMSENVVITASEMAVLSAPETRMDIEELFYE